MSLLVSEGVDLREMPLPLAAFSSGRLALGSRSCEGVCVDVKMLLGLLSRKIPVEREGELCGVEGGCCRLICPNRCVHS